MSELILVAGPNGAGKTTLFQHAFPDFDRIDADQIARSLDPGGSRTDAVAAGRRVVRLIDEAIEARRDFVFETTFAGRQPIDLVKRAKGAAYICTINFVLLADAELHVARVADRVRAGGHEVDPETVRRRYARSVENLLEHASRFDKIAVIENSGEPTTLFTFTNGKAMVYIDTPLTRDLAARLSPKPSP